MSLTKFLANGENPNRGRLFDCPEPPKNVGRRCRDRIRRSRRMIEQPGHFAGMSLVQASVSTVFGWTVQNNLTGAVYTPIQNSGTINKKMGFGTAAANNLANGGDEVFSFQQGIAANTSATLDLTAMTNLLAQATVSIARIKGVQFRLLSAADDATITPAPTATSTCTVTNIGPAVPSPMDFQNGGSGLTVTLTVGSTIVTGVAIGAAGTGYPPSSTFLASPVQAAGSGCVFAVVTNASGVPTSVVFITGAGGTGYSNATVPTVGVGQYTIYTGGTHMYFDVKPAGFCLVGSTAKNIMFYNNDVTKAITVEIDFLAATT